MIAKLSGRLDSTGENQAIIDVGGVGYLVFCSARTLAALPASGEQVALLIETHVREDHIHLYGFADSSERDWFGLLTSVQGVGVRVALAILGVLAPAALAAAIAAADKAAVTQAPGVGAKLAARIVTELKEKAGTISLPTALAGESGAGATGAAVEDGPLAEAISALVNLGYGRTEAFGAVSRAVAGGGDDLSTAALIKAGLKELAS